MTKRKFDIAKFRSIQTPFFYYDTDLLRETLTTLKVESKN